MENEVWISIPDTHYEASDQGNIRNTKYKRLLKPTVRKRDGYLVVTIHRLGIKRQFFVHSLIANAFIGDIPSGYSVNHKSGVKSDNTVGNLEIVTIGENIRHAVKLGLRADRRGELCPTAKLCRLDVEAIRERLSLGEPGQRIAKDYCVDPATISCIKNGTTWKVFE